MSDRALPSLVVRPALRISHEGRAVDLVREGDGGSVMGAADSARDEVARAALAMLRIEPRYGLRVPFDGPGITGRIRDAGGPRPSCIIDGESPGESRGSDSAATLEEAIVELLEALERGDETPESVG